MDYINNDVYREQRTWGTFGLYDSEEWQLGPTIDHRNAHPADIAFGAYPIAPVDRYVFEPHGPWSYVREPLHLPPMLQEPAGCQQLPPLATYSSHDQQRMSSPSNSGPSSADLSSAWSDRHSTPLSSPGPSAAEYSPHSAYLDAMPPSFGGGLFGSPLETTVTPFALHGIQFAHDSQPNQIVFDDGHNYFNQVPEEGYQPQDREMDAHNDASTAPPAASRPRSIRPESPNIHRRRTSSSRVATSPTSSSKVAKRPNTPRKTSSSSAKASSKQQATVDAAANRPFLCALARYECTSAFGSKNEWKRHVFTQHMRPGRWCCDMCDKKDGLNTFNRKDLFLQHVKRMHTDVTENKKETPKSSGSRSPKKAPQGCEGTAIANRCYQKIRSLPEKSGCSFCKCSFRSWDERMEHIGQHMEVVKKEGRDPVDPSAWKDDYDLHDYLVEEGIVEEDDRNRWVLADASR
ncbi:uncharacterized protein LTR77_001517 [Saxophila tyrrhenica]|uniref:C2H2-type domain-containing protein n=1 Tax=Saxophila tyrrhenica TaxID=1690608 RepID=A0AAV9PMB7_9PEZI|nr:hypothetical protein LTR77_001517 [Saxophila tyrrhenica]